MPRQATSGFRPDLALAIAHHDDATRRALIAAVGGTVGSGIMVIGIAAEGPTAHALVRRTAPDVAIIEVGLAGIDGLAVARALDRELPACRVILLGDEEQASEAYTTGAAGWLDGSWPRVDLARVVRGVARRESRPHATWAAAVLSASDVGEDPEALDPLDPLDRSILEPLARGDDIDAVTVALGLTHHLVGRRVSDAMQRARSNGR